MCNEGDKETIRPKSLEEVQKKTEEIQEPCALCLEQGRTTYTKLYEKTLAGTLYPICYGCLQETEEDIREHGSEEVEIITLNLINQELRRSN